ncbi:MAG TPA: glycosyltransferase family 4 protein [Polyangia bacterium]|nr:glycosyltransferase family 4 protein [Polyangia bacterium]
MRILLLHNIVNPHMTPVFEALSKSAGVDLTIAFFAEREADRAWDAGAASTFRSVVLPGRQLNLLLRWDTLSFHVNPGFGRFLRGCAPDVVINSGWMSLTNWHAFLACRRRRIPHVLWAGSTANEPSLQRSATRPAVRYLVRHSDAWASYGSASADYLVSLGAVRERVVPAYHCIDNARFLELVARTQPRVAAERAALGFGEARVVLFVGRMLERKGGDHLIDAVARVQHDGRDVALLFVGDGAMRITWEKHAAATLRPGSFRFVGNRPLEELPLYYQLADLFVLPSLEEVWGLVVNEAELAGLPVIASAACGATIDLVEQGVNGHRFAPGDVAGLARAIDTIAGDDHARAAMGAASRRLVERCTPSNVAASLLRAAELAVAGGRIA